MTFDPGREIRDGVHDACWTDTDLWIASIALGGSLDLGDVIAITAGDRPPTRRQYDVFAVALNEHFGDLGHDHPVPAWDGGS
jgi:hypothetical protein